MALRSFGDADRHAIAQHSCAVTQRRNLRHAVGDENDGVASVTPAAHHGVDLLGHIRGKRGRDLVEEQDRRLGGERPRQIDEAQQRVRQIANELAEIQAGDAEFAEPSGHGSRGRADQAHVLADRQIRH